MYMCVCNGLTLNPTHIYIHIYIYVFIYLFIYLWRYRYLDMCIYIYI